MWRHQAGRIDFDEPLGRLWRRGWGFREYAPIVGARDDCDWSVVGVHDGARVQGDRPERREAWAEAVRLALMVAVEAQAHPGGPFVQDRGGPPPSAPIHSPLAPPGSAPPSIGR